MSNPPSTPPTPITPTMTTPMVPTTTPAPVEVHITDHVTSIDEKSTTKSERKIMDNPSPG